MGVYPTTMIIGNVLGNMILKRKSAILSFGLNYPDTKPVNGDDECVYTNRLWAES